MIIVRNIYPDISKQGLGNRLFQYCWSRYLAEAKGYKLVSNHILGFPETYKDIDGLIACYNIVCTKENTQIFDIPSLLSHNGGILVAGSPQRYEHFISNKHNIKKWLYIEEEYKYDIPDTEDIVLNVRLGDYVNLGWDIGMEYYLDILKKETYKNAIIVTDEPDSTKLKPLIDFGCVIKRNYGLNKYLADFVFVKNADKVILSNSTFSWWAGFLGEGEVYFPCFKFPWKNPIETFKSVNIEEIDLRVYDESRYHFIY